FPRRRTRRRRGAHQALARGSDNAAPAPSSPPPLPETSARDRPAFVRVFALVEPDDAVVVPPRRFVLSPMELHHVREQEPRLLLVRAFVRLDRHALEQAVAQPLQLGVELTDRFGCLAVARLRTRQRVAGGNRFRSEPLEPVPKAHRGFAIL